MDEFLKSSPPEFQQFFDHSRSLGFVDKPDYHLLRGILRRRMEEEGWEYDDHYDWLDSNRADGTLLQDEYRYDKRFTTPPKSSTDLKLAYVFT